MTKIITTFSFLIFLGSALISCTAANNRPAPVEDFSKTNPPTKKTATKVQGETAKGQVSANKLGVTSSSESIKIALQQHYNEWRGVKYKYGGLSKNGIDCSGFTYITYKNLFNKNTPRSTKLLANSGKFINKSQLQPGDLVLYKTTSTVRHVGIYYGDNKFLHASKSKGVMISDMNLDYWRSRYWQSRRVL